MSQWRQAAVVAQWEFRRYFKWKDQAMGFVVFLVLSGLGYIGGRIARAEGRMVTVAVTGFQPGVDTSGRLRFVPAPTDEYGRAEALANGDVQGILTRRADGTFELQVENDPRYRGELEAFLRGKVLSERLAESGIAPERLAHLLAPPSLDVRFTDPERGKRGRGEGLVAGIVISILLLAVFTSMAYILTGITGEKQLRVTESIVSIIPPQAWIDGKILGLAAYALAAVLNMLVGGLVVALGAKLAWGFAIPDVAVRPIVLLSILAFALLGLLLWNAFFAAVAAIIDDPNTSSRMTFMFLPMLPVVMALSVLRDPDSVPSRVLSLFPLTSLPAMPARIVLSNPGWLEIGASVALLVATIWAARRIAGRIFEVGILLYGKEPSLREIVRIVNSKVADSR